MHEREKEDIMKEITSTKNSLIKELKKLHKKKHRIETNSYLIEGEHLVEEAFTYQAEIISLLVTKDSYQDYHYLTEQVSDDSLYVVTDDVLKVVSSLPTPQGIIAVIRKTEVVKNQQLGRMLLLDRVQDPGNVGTMIRTADAAGFTHVILGEGCADIYQSKVLRAMQGSQYHLTLEEANLTDFILKLKEENYQVYGTELNEEAIDYREIDSTDKLAIIMGNEGQGVAQELLELTDKNLYIPIKGKAESLNVAIAAGIIMFSL